MSNALLHWPVFIKQLQQDELLYLSQFEELHEQLPMLGDLTQVMVIDARGCSYQISDDNASVSFSLSAPQVLMPTLIDWVRLHASQAGQCCTSKLMATDISQLFSVLEFIEQN